MKKGDPKKLVIDTFDNGIIEINAVYLGKGQFATCYTDGINVYSYVKQVTGQAVDYSKEAISLWADTDNKHVPNFERIAYIEDTDAYVYKSPLYKNLTTKDKQAYKDFKTLESLWYSAPNTNDYIYDGYTFIDSLDGVVTEDIKEALYSILQSCCNYEGVYRFEFPKRNLKVDNDGNLVLLDVIFNVEALIKSFKS